MLSATLLPDSKMIFIMFQAYPAFLVVYVVLVNIPGHSKVRHFTHLPLTNQHIPCCQITMDDLSVTCMT